jgi:hypothetical protein
MNTDTQKAVDFKHQQYELVKSEKNLGSNFVKRWTKKSQRKMVIFLKPSQGVI